MFYREIIGERCRVYGIRQFASLDGKLLEEAIAGAFRCCFRGRSYTYARVDSSLIYVLYTSPGKYT